MSWDGSVAANRQAGSHRLRSDHDGRQQGNTDMKRAMSHTAIIAQSTARSRPESGDKVHTDRLVDSGDADRQLADRPVVAELECQQIPEVLNDPVELDGPVGQ